MAKDAAEAAPNVYTVLFENERVRLLEARVKPGERGNVAFGVLPGIPWPQTGRCHKRNHLWDRRGFRKCLSVAKMPEQNPRTRPRRPAKSSADNRLGKSRAGPV